MISQIENPNKYDIIPIHTSDRATFKFCRRQWGWSSPSKANLVPKSSVYGVYEPFWFGNGIHESLQFYYGSGVNPATHFANWFDLQWKGGVISKRDIKQFIDRNPTKIDDDTFQVEGLRDVLMNPDEEKFMKLRDLGVGMMKFYAEWAKENDDFEVVAVEHDFSVPVFHPGTKTPLYWHDNREMPDWWEPNFTLSNAYGSIMREGPEGVIQKQVHARGRMDMIKFEPHSRQFGIQDYKTASVLDEDYFRHLELDEQCTTYLWASQIEAEMHDLPYKDVSFITYMGLFKGYPQPPTITSKGLPSINRKTESTTADIFEQTINLLGLRSVFESDPKMIAYYEWLRELGDKRFIWPEDVTRNKIQRENAGIRIFYEARDMLNDPALYPNPSKNYGCLNCRFRVPCIAAETGGDYKAMIADGYVQNWDR